MADADDNPTTNNGAAAGIRDLVEQVRAYAAAHDLLASEVVAQLNAQLTNAPPDVAPGRPDSPEPPTGRPGSAQLAMPRRRREELRRINQRLVAELAAAPLADRAAFLERKRAEVAAVVEREGLPSGHSTLITELVLAHFAHLRGLSDAGAEAYSLAAVLRSLDTPGSLVRDFGLLDHLHDLRSALNAADQGRAGPLMRRLPPKKPNGGRPRDTTSALMDGTIGGAMAGLLLGGVMRGGAGTESAAAERVITAYAAEGIDLGKQAPRKALQACRRLERADNKRQPLCQGDQTLARDTLDIFQTVLRTARTILAQRGDKGVWPLQEREAAWLAPLAYGARTRAS